MPDNRYLSLTSSSIARLSPYLPGKPISALERDLGISHSIKLASNENPRGASPKVTQYLQQAMTDISRYPDGGGVDLRDQLAEKHQLDPQSITLGNGSNDVLDMIARVFLRPGIESIFSQYAFAVYPIASQTVGAIIKSVPANHYGYDLAAIKQAITDKTGVIWIANPNNPTGTWLESNELKAFIDDVPDNIIVVVDEAYIEYVSNKAFPDSSLWLSEYPNLIVTRTFSKAYGLASMRIGYALSHPDIADLLNRVRQPFNVNSLALASASIALKDQDFIQQSVTLNQQGMKQLEAGFSDLNLDYIPSAGNFITLDVGQAAQPIDQALLQLGCITRPLANYGLPNHLRISIGLPEENQRFLASLAEILATC